MLSEVSLIGYLECFHIVQITRSDLALSAIHGHNTRNIACNGCIRNILKYRSTLIYVYSKVRTAGGKRVISNA